MKFSFLLTFFLFSIISCAQKFPDSIEVRKNKTPFFVVNDSVVIDFYKNDKLDPSSIESIAVIKENNDTSYGFLKRNLKEGAVLIEMKKEIKIPFEFKTQAYFFEQFNLPENSAIYYNGYLLDEKYLLDVNFLEKMEVIEGKYLNMNVVNPNSKSE